MTATTGESRSQADKSGPNISKDRGSSRPLKSASATRDRKDVSRQSGTRQGRSSQPQYPHHRDRLPISDPSPLPNSASGRRNKTNKAQSSVSNHVSTSQAQQAFASASASHGKKDGMQSKHPNLRTDVLARGSDLATRNPGLSVRPKTDIVTRHVSRDISSDLCVRPKRAFPGHVFTKSGTLRDGYGHDYGFAYRSSHRSLFLPEDVYEFERPADFHGPCLHNVIGINDPEDGRLAEAASQFQEREASPFPTFHIPDNLSTRLARRLKSSDKLNWDMFRFEDSDELAAEEIKEQCVTQPEIEAMKGVLSNGVGTHRDQAQSQEAGVSYPGMKRKQCDNNSPFTEFKDSKRFVGQITE